MTLRPAPKPMRRVKSRTLTDSARGRHCTLRLDGCLPGTETVVFAHFRGRWALGIASKPHDYFGALACHACHAKEETSDCTDNDRLRALYETWEILIAEGVIQIKGAA